MRRLFCLICISLLCIFCIANASEIDGNQLTPTTEPEPTPTTEPEPTPTTEPEPTPTTEPEPTPTTEPEPTPTTEPEPTPTTEPEPTPTTEPEPTPTTELEPTPTTEPEPTPTTEPEPTPTTEPGPTPTTELEPTPTTELEPTPTTEPKPTPTTEPEPTPTSTPSFRLPTKIDVLADAPVYDVNVSFDDSGFTYSYSGEYKDGDYSGVSGNWTDNTAFVTVSCGTDSNPVQVYITNSSLDSSICSMTAGDSLISISASNSCTEENPAILNAGESTSITYTASGTIPFDASLPDGNGGSFFPRDFIGSTVSDIPILRVNVYIDAAATE